MYSCITDKAVSKSYSVCNEDIAIIGMDCNLPNCNGIQQLWLDLGYGRDHLASFPNARHNDIKKYYEWKGSSMPELRKGNYLQDISSFDYKFFGITPKEATLMNPNHRILLQTVYRTFQDAGLNENNITGSYTGLFIGYIGDYEGSLYSYMVNETQPETSPTGCLASMMAGRISYLLDLHGPAVMIDTACSSSLVAVYQACAAIRSGMCTMAIAAGVRTILNPDAGNSIGIESQDGATRPFDKNASGTGIGEGVAAVLLKPLSEAQKDRDLIYAVIKGGAVNQDGKGIGLTAPNVNAQISVVKTAWRNTGICPTDISYIEAHGTATKIGDPVELDGLNKAFRCFTNEKNFCTVGSVKSNFGHLYDCAGIISVIKTALMIQNQTIVPTVHFKEINPEFDLNNSSLRIASKLETWNARNGKRIAGVSSFGFSGTNCHMVLEEAPNAWEGAYTEKNKEELILFTASAKSLESLYSVLNKYRIFCCRIKEKELPAFCSNSQTTRTHYKYRTALTVNSVNDLLNKLELIYDYRVFNEENFNEEGIFYGIADCHDFFEASDDISTQAKQYVIYADTSFEKFHYHNRKAKIRLPLYPFEKERCWIVFPENTNQPLCKGSKLVKNKIKKEVVLTGRSSGLYTDTEIYLAQIFCDEMGYGQLSVNDDIYSLGGDSITAYHIVSKINSDYGAELTMSDILECCNISKLAELVDRSASDKKSKYHIPKAEYVQWYPLSYAQQRMYFMYLREPQCVYYNMPFIMYFKGKLDIQKLEKAFCRIVELHDIFRTHFIFQDGKALQRVSEKEKFQIEHIYSSFSEETAMAERKSFDLEKDILIKVKLFHVKEGHEYVVYIDMNHIVCDGSSLGIMIEEFVYLYQGGTLEKQDVQYTDYAIWQRNFNMKQLENFWERELNNIIQCELPLDHLRSNSVFDVCNIQSFSFTQEEYEQLKNICLNNKVGMFGLLFAGYQAALAAFIQTDEVISGTPISGRTAIETQRMVGMFVNVMPLRTRITISESFTEYVKNVYSKILEILEHQDYPFELLVDKLKIRRENNRNPIYDTVFAFQNMTIPEINLPELDVKIRNEDNISKFDITVEVMEQNGGLLFTLKYNSSLFENSTIRGFSTILHQGFLAVIQTPEASIGELFVNSSANMSGSGFEEIDFDFN